MTWPEVFEWEKAELFLLLLGWDRMDAVSLVDLVAGRGGQSGAELWAELAGYLEERRAGEGITPYAPSEMLWVWLRGLLALPSSDLVLEARQQAFQEQARLDEEVDRFQWWLKDRGEIPWLRRPF